LIGKITIPLDEALTTLQGRWINKIYELENKKEKNCGLLSFMFQWKQKGSVSNEEIPQPLQLKDYFRGVKPTGTIIVGCV